MSSSFINKNNQQSFKTFDVGVSEENLPLSSENVLDSSPLPQPQRVLSPEERNAYLKERKIMAATPNTGDYVRQRIEFLANIGRIYKDITLGETKFTLKTLKNNESKIVACESVAVSSHNIEASYEMRRRTVAFALHKIDDLSIEELLGSSDFSTRLNLVDSLEESVFEVLYNECAAMRNEALSKFTPKNETEAKEVFNEIKKL